VFHVPYRQLLEAVVGEVKPGTSQQTQLSMVLDKLIERDREIQQLTETGEHKSLRFEE